MSLRLTDLSPFRAQADFKASVANWRQIAAELEAEADARPDTIGAGNATHTDRSLKHVWQNGLDAVRPRKSASRR